ncbi:sulfatase-like hydrolase/transferase [Mangrovivirga sp. M17]|uniref:Sulfatase-like hydrolase/transferase n=1 Tax=Mangrovivirga halotolerans TaxID=2993936 RepID=A0ABT3RP84_9BACT|nr:sulfatase-like hydrolase/transferase [Mangrovivirga halotolerans]MCX2743169.1 sulfatase-like hydrolase/transferase [Mangrovivirga halotolerans]
MLRNIVLFGFVLSLIILLVYLLLPLESDRFELTPNEDRLVDKIYYLNNPPISENDSPPNIIWIVVDDLSMADTDLYGDGPVSVPNMKKLANRGVKFNNAYVSAPVCSPSRAAIVTGRYNQRFGYEHQLHDRYLKNRLEYLGFRYLIDSDPWVPQYQTEVPSADFIENIGLPSSEITFAEVAKKYGFETGYIGKWHLGKKEDNSPNAFGFDHFYGFYSSHSLYIPEGTRGYVEQKIPDDFTDEYIWEGQRKGQQAIRRNGEIISEDRYLTSAITDEAIDFTEAHNEKPFYLLVSYNAPHTPLQAPKEYVEMFNDVSDPVKRVHFALIKSLDDELGRLMNHFNDKRLTENTLIFFISDNGGAEFNLTTENGPYQGGKITNFEGGVKVPMIMSWQGKIDSGEVFNHPVHSTDLFMTSARAIKAKLPADRIYDGADLIKHVGNNTMPHDYIYFDMGNNRGIRGERWKLVWNEANGDSVLFNLKEDPYEQRDVYEFNREVVKKLTNEFEEWAAKNIDPIWPPMIYYHYTTDDGKEYFFDE